MKLISKRKKRRSKREKLSEEKREYVKVEHIKHHCG